MCRFFFLPLLLCFRLAIAQAPKPAATQVDSPPSPLLSAQAAYDQASAPVDITHRSIANWSDIEKAALEVAVAQAKDACLARVHTTFTGDDLISYARLCDLAQQWQNVFTAATNYINSHDAVKPQLDQAYAFEVYADLNLKQWKGASGACFAMLKSVPYGPLTDSVTTTTVRFLQFAYLADALDLLLQRQRYLLDLIQSSSSGSAQPGSQPAPAISPPAQAAQSIPLHTLFEHALDFAALQQYNAQPERAAAALSEIDRAMPPSLPPDEAIFIAADRHQYALLGTRFFDFPSAVPLLSATASHHVNPGSVTVFLLFPPWCAQCIRQEHEMTLALLRHADSGVHMYGLLADSPPPPALPAKTQFATGSHRASEPPAKPEPAKTAVNQLRGTPTLVVAPSTLADFNAADFPFLIATDHDGMIRLMVPGAPENAFVQGGPVDQVIENMLAHWPPSPARPAP